MDLKKDNLKIIIKKSDIDDSIFIEIKDGEITYYSKDKNLNNNVWIEPQSISDAQFVTQIIKELYFPVSECIKKYKQELEMIEPREIIRPKNTARYDLSIFDEDFYTELDLYVNQTPKAIYEFGEKVIVTIKKYLQENFSTDETISLNELIKISTQPDLFWEMKLKQFFDKLSNISEKEKVYFLKKILDNREKFNEFTKEVNKNENSEEVFNKYNI